MGISDQPRYHSGEQINAGKQGHSTVALIFVITTPCAVLLRWRTVICCIADGLNAGLLIVGDEDLTAQFISSSALLNS